MYKQTEEWKEYRELALERAKRMCQLCGSTEELHVHHRRYNPDSVSGVYEIEDLTVLCKTCHFMFHKTKGSPGKGVEASYKGKSKKATRLSKEERVAKQKLDKKIKKAERENRRLAIIELRKAKEKESEDVLYNYNQAVLRGVGYRAVR